METAVNAAMDDKYSLLFMQKHLILIGNPSSADYGPFSGCRSVIMNKIMPPLLDICERLLDLEEKLHG
jgi:hypothetical protein